MVGPGCRAGDSRGDGLEGRPCGQAARSVTAPGRQPPWGDPSCPGSGGGAGVLVPLNMPPAPLLTSPLPGLMKTLHSLGRGGMSGPHRGRQTDTEIPPRPPPPRRLAQLCSVAASEPVWGCAHALPREECSRNDSFKGPRGWAGPSPSCYKRREEAPMREAACLKSPSAGARAGRDTAPRLPRGARAPAQEQTAASGLTPGLGGRPPGATASTAAERGWHACPPPGLGEAWRGGGARSWIRQEAPRLPVKPLPG